MRYFKIVLKHDNIYEGVVAADSEEDAHDRYCQGDFTENIRMGMEQPSVEMEELTLDEYNAEYKHCESK